MSTRDQLNSYIEQLEQRLRLGAMLRGAAILTSVALVDHGRPRSDHQRSLRFRAAASPARASLSVSALVAGCGLSASRCRCRG